MATKQSVTDLIVQQGVLPLYFNSDPEVSIEVLRALYRAGIRAVEYTNRGEAAFRNFAKMREVSHSEMPELQLGIGTIKNAPAARSYMEAGADFIVCPGLIEEVAEVVDRYEKLWVPGCMTPSEIIRAENMGAKMVKLFPGNILGPGFMSAIKELFPDLLFMPTGGVDLEEASIAGWFKAGVCAVGMGSKLISKSLLEKKDYESIEKLTLKALSMVKTIR